MSAPPAEGKVYEGWFVDDGGSGYKLSLGEFPKNGTLTSKNRWSIHTPTPNSS